MNRRIKTILTSGLAIVLLAQSQFTHVIKADSESALGAQDMMETARMKPMAVPGRLLVKYRAGVSSKRRNTLMMAAGGRAHHEVPGLGIHVLEFAYGADEDVYARVLRLQSEVEFAEPDFLCYPVDAMTPDDPLFSSQWHLPTIGCPTAWGMTSGSDQITIALCDTGVESTHPDLAAKLVPGWNVVDGNSDTSPVASHGTWTAGTAAATGNNSIGVASPALNCLIMPIRVSSRTDGAALVSDMAAGVVWAADHGARVASVSYMGADSDIMSAAGQYMQSKGGVLVMASGNTGTYDAMPDNPSIIVVGATTQSDSVASFSTTGSFLDLSAPGVNVLTTAPGGTYQSVSGTSFSTPLVAGAAALMLSINPNLLPAQIDTILKVSADDLGPQGWDSSYGWGRLNVGRAIGIVEDLLNSAPDTTPPAVGFLQPQIGGAVSGLVGISRMELVKVNALDDRAVNNVSFLADGALMGTATSAPYQVYWDTSSLIDASQHTLTAVATDQAGNVTTISALVTTKAGFDATPPVISFVQPLVTDGGASVGRSKAEYIQLDSQDGTAVSYVQLSIDGVVLGTLTAAPYTFVWNTSSLAMGSTHALVAVSADPAGNWTVLSVTATVGAASDTTPPAVSFLQPQAGGAVNNSQGEQITVSASDNVAVASVSLYADGALVGTDASAPYAFSWNTASFAAGSQHTLRAVAADQAGNSTSASITVTVGDTIAPQVNFVSPTNGGTVKGNETVLISATDNIAVTRVDFYIDNKVETSLSRAPYSVRWNTNKAARGSHTLTCVAFDAAGNSTSTSISVIK
jgi:subtilisin family serine protease